MKRSLALLTLSGLLSVFSAPAFASYISVSWNDDGSVSSHLWSDADGYTFTIEEFSDNLRIDATLDGSRMLRMTALDGILVPGITGPGSYDIKSFDGDDPAKIDHSTFQTEGPGDYFEIVSLGTWDGDYYDSIEFNFQITEGSDMLNGSGCIGSSCGASPVPVPSAVWLFGSALGFLGWQRRSTKAAS